MRTGLWRRRYSPLFFLGRDMSSFPKRFHADQGAATAIEYGLIAGLIALVVIVGMGVTFTAISAKFAVASNAIVAH